MKKRIFIGVFIVFSLVIISCNLHKKCTKIDDDNVLGIYLDNELQTSIPKKGEAVFSKAVCDNDEVNYYWDIDNWGLYINNFSNKMKCNLYFVNYSGETTFDFDYTGGEQTFVAPVSGTYKLETWGAQGGHGQTTYTGGYGGYSFGIITLNVNTTVYLNVGGSGSEFDGGYNGGGNRTDNHASWRGGSGGGATHIALKSGLISALENYKEKILMVSGGGGGACGNLNDVSNNGGHGGGEKGTVVDSIATSGTQLYSGVNADGKISASFGKGANSTNEGAGGGGFYGGGSGYHNDIGYSGAGGSGYIGNPLLKNKVMYCYNCEESSEKSTKTISTTCSEETPTSYCAKKGNGYARITLVSLD